MLFLNDWNDGCLLKTSVAGIFQNLPILPHFSLEVINFFTYILSPFGCPEVGRSAYTPSPTPTFTPTSAPTYTYICTYLHLHLLYFLHSLF